MKATRRGGSVLTEETSSPFNAYYACSIPTRIKRKTFCIEYYSEHMIGRNKHREDSAQEQSPLP